ncbi:unnamed protein product [Spirodela intermedia]|uniref:Uncharacterized protein n=1 Tax=Spirodela intermedia TaxID=51605 RepID=A0ABN7E946_SPIIN|nr:unnamed protein product [Spirodela intermedia]
MSHAKFLLERPIRSFKIGASVRKSIFILLYAKMGCNIISQSLFSRVYDHSLPHSRLATGDVEGEWRTRAYRSPS